jgi:tetratricopeptide (TPR) repeat protein
MKNTRLTILVISMLANTVCWAQQTTEIVKDGNTENKVTISELDKNNEKAYATSKSKDALDYAAKAQDYADKKDFKNAEKYYLLALKADPEYVKAYDNLGVVYRRMGEYDKAVEKYNQSINLFPNGKAAHQNLAAVFIVMKQYDDAAKEYVLLLKLDPNDPEGYFGYANLSLTQQQYDNALKYANEAFSLYEKQKSPLASDAQYLVGIIYYTKGDSKNAIKYFRLAKKNGAIINPSLIKELKL